MPELPEVETVVRSITNKIIGKNIKLINVFWKKTLSTHSENEINKILFNEKIINISRIGKYIIIHFNLYYLIIHLRMTGKLIFLNSLSDFKSTHLRFKILFTDNSILNFTDIRKFGRIELRCNLQFLYKKLGPEPLTKDLKIEYLQHKLQSRKVSIKACLLNQNIIAGLGNIYTDEILWKIKVHPNSKANMLNLKLLEKLIFATNEIISNAIDLMGTTIINFSFDKESKGKYGSHLKVFNQKNNYCYRCNGIIIKIKCANRGTYFCNNCQILY